MYHTGVEDTKTNELNLQWNNLGHSRNNLEVKETAACEKGHAMCLLVGKADF